MDIRIAALALGMVGLVAACGRAPSPASTTPPTRTAAPPAGIEKTLFVAAERKPCTGVAPMECLQVRESTDRPWQHFYSEIEGFVFEPGFDYELRVLEEKVANPPADGSSLRWTLVTVVSKQVEQAPRTP